MVRIKKAKKDSFFGVIESEFSSGKVIEGMVIRPAIQLLSFSSFVLAMFLLLFQNLKWGGSLIIFAFILNLESIYKSLTDKLSIYRTLNLWFKIIMFSSEIILFNYIIIKFLY